MPDPPQAVGDSDEMLMCRVDQLGPEEEPDAHPHSTFAWSHAESIHVPLSEAGLKGTPVPGDFAVIQATSPMDWPGSTSGLNHFFFLTYFFLGPRVWHEEVPRLRTESQLQLQVYVTARAKPETHTKTSRNAGSLTH